jgi:hypothetical protein
LGHRRFCHLSANLGGMQTVFESGVLEWGRTECLFA